MKKILVGIIICILSFGSMGVSFAEVNMSQQQLIKNIILKKREIEKNIGKGKEYVKALDTFFEKYKDDNEKIEILMNRVSTIKSRIGNTSIDKKVFLIIEYIEYKNALRINYLTGANSATSEKENDIFNMSEEELWNFGNNLQYIDLKNIINTQYGSDLDVYNQFAKVYNTQIKKAQDVTRINDLKAIKSGLEQIYFDDQKYPNKENIEEKISIWIQSIPKDKLAGYNINSCDFGYMYEYNYDLSKYKLSACLESEEYISERAMNSKDGGNDDKRYEIGDWNENTVFTHRIYLNGISEWKTKIKNTSYNFDSLDQKLKKEILLMMLYEKYLENNPEVIEGQKQKSRDTKRRYDLMDIRSSIELHYSENFEYPSLDDLSKVIIRYNGKISKDELNGKNVNGCLFGYYYEVGDINHSISGDTIKNQTYRLTSCQEGEDKIIYSTYGDEDTIFTEKKLIQ